MRLAAQLELLAEEAARNQSRPEDWPQAVEDAYHRGRQSAFAKAAELAQAASPHTTEEDTP